MFMVAGQVVGLIWLLVSIFIAAFFLGIALPLIYATIEDYIERLGHSANALVGLENSTTSVAFIVGPVLAGWTAALIGNQAVFTVMGILLFACSFLAIMVVPRKIHLPQQSLAIIK
jgi:MFS family permease